MESEHPFESELIARIGWLIQLRWVAAIGTAAAIVLAALWFPGTLAVGPLLIVTGLVAAYNLQLTLYLRSLKGVSSGTVRLPHATSLAYAQIVLDLLGLVALIHFAGGIENPLALFFVFHVIIASILLRREVSYVMAGVAAVLYAAVAGLEYAGVLAHHHLPLFSVELYREPRYLLVSAAAMASTLFIVAYLATSISARLRERERELFASNSTCQVRSYELTDLNEQLRRLDAERTRFMILVTHELRAPVGTIYSSLELVRAGYTTPQETQEMLARAQTRASELLELIGDLLNLTKLREQPVRRDSLAPMQIGDVLRDVVEFVQPEVTRNNLSLQVDVAPDLAPVRAVAEQMKLVWTNLLSNAIKYNRPGGSILVTLRQDAGQVTCQVRDTGIGIAPEDLPHMFDEFFRADNAKLVSPHGTGVGLAIIRRIVEGWGGKISVESKLGQGTTFTFVLPRADAPSPS